MEQNNDAPAATTFDVAQLERQRDEYLALLKEKQAEFENYQKRAARERIEEQKYWTRALVSDLLPALDNLERALSAAASDANSLIQGVAGTQKQLHDILARHGIQRIEVTPGTTFDPNAHEAVMQQPSAEVAAGQVIQVLAAGYRIHDRVLRPATVIVSSGPAQE